MNVITHFRDISLFSMRCSVLHSVFACHILIISLVISSLPSFNFLFYLFLLKIEDIHNSWLYCSFCCSASSSLSPPLLPSHLSWYSSFKYFFRFSLPAPLPFHHLRSLFGLICTRPVSVILLHLLEQFSTRPGVILCTFPKLFPRLILSFLPNLWHVFFIVLTWFTFLEVFYVTFFGLICFPRHFTCFLFLFISVVPRVSPASIVSSNWNNCPPFSSFASVIIQFVQVLLSIFPSRSFAISPFSFFIWFKLYSSSVFNSSPPFRAVFDSFWSHSLYFPQTLPASYS